MCYCLAETFVKDYSKETTMYQVSVSTYILSDVHYNDKLLHVIIIKCDRLHRNLPHLRQGDLYYSPNILSLLIFPLIESLVIF